MARDPRGAWAAMPRPHPPPKRRRPPGAGKSRKPGSPVSSKTSEAVYVETVGLICPNTSSGRSGEVLARLRHSPPGLAGSAPTYVLSIRSARRYLSPERLASVRREDPRSRTTSSSSNCSAKKEG